MPFKWLKRRRNTLAATERPTLNPSSPGPPQAAAHLHSSASSQTEPRIRRRKSFFQTLRGVRDAPVKQRTRASSFSAETPIPKSLQQSDVPPVPPLPRGIGTAPIAGKFARAPPPSAFPGSLASTDPIPQDGRRLNARPIISNTAPSRISAPVKTIQLDDYDDRLSEFGVVNPLDALDRLDAANGLPPVARGPVCPLNPRTPLPDKATPAKKHTSMLDGPLPPPPPGATITPTKRTSKRFSMQNPPPMPTLPSKGLPPKPPPKSDLPSPPSSAAPNGNRFSRAPIPKPESPLPSPVPSSIIAPNRSSSSTPEETPVSSLRRSVAHRALIPEDFKSSPPTASSPQIPSPKIPSQPSPIQRTSTPPTLSPNPTPSPSPPVPSPKRTSSLPKPRSPSAEAKRPAFEKRMSTRKPVPKLTLADLAMEESSPSPKLASPRHRGPVVPRSPKVAVAPVGLDEVVRAEKGHVLSPSISAVGLNLMGAQAEAEGRSERGSAEKGNEVKGQEVEVLGDAVVLTSEVGAREVDGEKEGGDGVTSNGLPEESAAREGGDRHDDKAAGLATKVASLASETGPDIATDAEQVLEKVAQEKLDAVSADEVQAMPKEETGPITDGTTASANEPLQDTTSVTEVAHVGKQTDSQPANIQVADAPTLSPAPTGTTDLIESDAATVFSSNAAESVAESEDQDGTPPATTADLESRDLKSLPSLPSGNTTPGLPAAPQLNGLQPPLNQDHLLTRSDSDPSSSNITLRSSEATTPPATSAEFSVHSASKSASACTTMSQSPSATSDWASSNTHSTVPYPVTPPNGLGSELSMTSVDADKVSISHSQTFGQLGNEQKQQQELDSPIASPTRLAHVPPRGRANTTTPLSPPDSPSSPPRATPAGRASSTSPVRPMPRVRTTSRVPSVANLRPVGKRSVTAPIPSAEPTLDDFMSIFKQVSQRPKDVSIKAAAQQAEMKRVRG